MSVGKPFALRCRKLIVAIGVLVWITNLPADAGVIDETAVPSGMEVFTFGPDNDSQNQELSDNWIVYEPVFHALGHHDLVLPVSNSDATSEYDFLLDLRNTSGTSFRGLMVTLGFLSGVSFQEATLPDLDFDTPNPNSQFSLLSFTLNSGDHGDTQIVWPNLPSSDYLRSEENETYSLNFTVDIPNADPLYIPTASLRDNGYDLTIRFTPIPVPEPATGLMMMVCGIILSRRQRRCTDPA